MSATESGSEERMALGRSSATSECNWLEQASAEFASGADSPQHRHLKRERFWATTPGVSLPLYLGALSCSHKSCAGSVVWKEGHQRHIG